jgi:hypothetical protein
MVYCFDQSIAQKYHTHAPQFFALVNHQESQMNITTTDCLVKYLVSSLTDKVDIQGRNISCDRFYSSIELANRLLEKKMTVVGTVKVSVT